MTFTKLRIDLKSLAVVLAAYIGNAQLFGLDLNLMILFPFILFVHLFQPWTMPRQNIFLFLVLTGTLLIVSAQAFLLKIPYFDGYYLWPLKSLLLMIFIAFGDQPTWPKSNMLALFILALATLALGHVVDGRLYSVFGPNMLYRLFGLLFLFAAIFFFDERAVARLLMVAVAGVGIYGLLLTGSSGALVVLGTALLILTYRWSRKLFAVGFVMFCSGVIFLLTKGDLINYLSSSGVVGVSRIGYKLSAISSDPRLIGPLTIFAAPPTFLGQQYQDFSMLWFQGYQYPHNIFAELYAFFGIAGVILGLAVLAAIPLALARSLAGDVFAMTFVVLFLGALLSGDLSDNFGIIGLACGLLLSRDHSTAGTVGANFQGPQA